MKSIKTIAKNSYGIQAERDINISIFFKQNDIQKYCLEANNVIKLSLNQFFKDFQTLLESKGLKDILRNLSIPNNNAALRDALKAITRNNIPEKRILLCNLLIEKFSHRKEDDSEDEYTQAIKVMDEISLKQIKLLVFIELSSTVMSFHFNNTPIPNIKNILNFLEQESDFNLDTIKYCENLNLIYNLFPHEIDRTGLSSRNEKDIKYINKINENLQKIKTINLNQYILSSAGKAISKIYINNYLNIDYLSSHSFPFKYTDITINNVQAVGNVSARGNVSAMAVLKD